MASRIENEVESIVEELIAGSPLELVAVDYVRERDWYLRVFIDKEGGIEIDDCQLFRQSILYLLPKTKTLFHGHHLFLSHWLAL